MPIKDKEARSSWNAAYYQRHKKRQREYMREFYAKRKERLRELKRDRACKVCGESDPCVLDFHHRIPSEKQLHISRDAWKVSEERLLEEVAKCDVLCANCHRREHCAHGLPPNGRRIEE